MNVALVGPVYPYRGGIAHYTTMLAQALAQRHVTHIISFRRQYPRWLYPGQTDRDPSQQPLRIEADYWLDPLFPWTGWETARRLARFEPAVTVIPWWTTFWAPVFGILAHALRQQGRRVVFLIHNVLPHEPRRGDAWLTRQVLRQGQAFIVQTQQEQARLQALLPGVTAQLVPHPAYTMFAGQSVPTAEARQRLGLPAEGLVLLFFGIVRAYKGLACLLEALACMPAPKPYLLVAGEFWEDKAGYLKQIERLGLRSTVRLEDGYIPNEDLGLYFSAANGLVAPYIGGTQSGAVQLALGFGLPLIISEQLVSAVVDDKVWMRVAPPGDVAALAQALTEFAKAVPARQAGASAEGWQNLVTAIEQLSQLE